MKILDRYIAKTLLQYSFAVLVVLVGVFAFFKFLEEVDTIGRANYTLIDAITYIALLIPSMTHALSSLVILLGVILGLGYLASNSELVVMRASGTSVIDITKTVLKLSVILAVLVTLFGEVVAPYSAQQAKNYRAKTLGERIIGAGEQGFWLKDGSSFIRVDKNIDGKVFRDTMVVKTADGQTLESVAFAKHSTFEAGNMQLNDADLYQLDSTQRFTQIEKTDVKHIANRVDFDQELLQSLKQEPQNLSSWKLLKHIGFLSRNNLAADAYEVELYSRIMKPFTLLAMIILSIPYVFGSLRDSSLGRKVFFGVALGLSFHLLSKIGSMVSLRFELNHFLSASAPTLVVASIALLLLYRQATR